MKKKVYVVISYRWGLRSEHGYLFGVYTKKHAALKAADFELEHRGGKYECRVLECDPESKFTGYQDSKTIRELGEVVYP